MRRATWVFARRTQGEPRRRSHECGSAVRLREAVVVTWSDRRRPARSGGRPDGSLSVAAKKRSFSFVIEVAKGIDPKVERIRR